MQADFWNDKYPADIPRTINPAEYGSVLEIFRTSVRNYGDLPSMSNMGRTLSFNDIDTLSAAFAAYIQNETDLKPGDRIAVQMPNILQYPVVVFGALRAGLIVVNTNPLYTAREMLHQFNDAGCKALVAVANFGNLVQEVLPQTGIKYLFMTEIGDMLPPVKRMITNFVIRRVKKMIPDYSLPTAIPFTRALAKGKSQKFIEARPTHDDIAVLQYTGGTTGVSKGAMLTHGNLVANLLQMRAVWTGFNPGKEVMMAPLPLYHIFAFAVSCLGMMERGGHTVLITNPRDMDGFVKEMARWPFTIMVGLNTLFVGLMHHKGFRELDFSKLKMTVSGGMALQVQVAQDWQKLTGCGICEGYGMTETSPVVSMNPLSHNQLGTIGMPVPGTQIKITDDAGNEQPLGERGELCVKGPQVMKGYWQRPDSTGETIDAEGWLKTGDIAIVQPDGYLKIVDRKKDMILVSGFNVYPNEIEDVAASCPGVLESAAIGVPDEKSGEAVKLFVVKKDPNLTEEAVKAHMRANLTGYKVPRTIVFRADLPKSNVGKILRRELRDK
jgi:long-chain acyl-CoA synthetase